MGGLASPAEAQDGDEHGEEKQEESEYVWDDY
jgi:hypothetical protein